MTAPLHHRRCWQSTPRPLARRILITAGPTYEPIDAVRFIGNRSSGRMGISLAQAAVELGWEVVLLLGPVPNGPSECEGLTVHRFRTCSDLERLLRQHVDSVDVLIMAAAVADYRPAIGAHHASGKLRRTEGPLSLHLESTPDLLASVAARRRCDQTIVGFALEPREGLVESAMAKLRRKRVDMVVANPLETMDADTIEAVVVSADGGAQDAPGVHTKKEFARWLLRRIDQYAACRAAPSHARSPAALAV